MSLTRIALVLSFATLRSSASARADECDPSRVMLIVDRSSSMQTGTIGGATKWSIAVDTIDTVVTRFEASLELGLMVFPDPDQCAPGAVVVTPALGNAQAIRGQLATPPPTSGNWTPIAETLAAAGESPSLAAGDLPRYAVLLTDGWQWCDPYDPSTRFHAVDTIQGLNDAGVTTYVVGFGAAVDPALLNRLAVAAGTQLPGCDPEAESADAPDHCYHQADDPAELLAALMQIAARASEETCDGVDNDCDGEVDEDLSRACQGGCGSGTETCADGAWSACSAPDHLCDAGPECADGTCHPPADPPDAGDPDDGGMTAGCGCRAAGGADSGWALGAIGALLLLRRRRLGIH